MEVGTGSDIETGNSPSPLNVLDEILASGFRLSSRSVRIFLSQFQDLRKNLSPFTPPTASFRDRRSKERAVCLPSRLKQTFVTPYSF